MWRLRGVLVVVLVLTGCGRTAVAVEACNGVDDDGDGRVDVRGDWAPLVGACPLDRGVCAGAVRTCVDGGWTECDYGPDYQVTERRCDGLDNDCDGTVDQSWVRVLLEADAGMSGALTLEETGWPSPVPGLFGTAWNLTYQVLSHDPDLMTVRTTNFPSISGGYAYSRLHAWGPNWLRVQHGYDWPGAPPHTLLHRVMRDGGFERAPDGGLQVLTDLTYSGTPWSHASIQMDGGWCGVAAQGPVPWGGGAGWNRLFWWSLQEDGGIQRGEVDAGAPTATTELYVVATRSGLLLWYRANPGHLEVLEVHPESWALTPRFAVSGDCHVAGVEPLTVLCAAGGSREWRAESGEVLLTSTAWLPRGGPWSRPCTVLSNVPGPDGGPVIGFRLGDVRDGGVLPWFEYTGESGPIYIQSYDLSGRLQLVMWGDHQGDGTCPDCTIGRFVARYACLPP